jgi:hypothetical protein
MSNFRIVRRTKWDAPMFYAQRKWLWWWIDCPGISCSGDEGYLEGAENPSRSLKLVKNYVEHVAENKVVYVYH